MVLCFSADFAIIPSSSTLTADRNKSVVITAKPGKHGSMKSIIATSSKAAYEATKGLFDDEAGEGDGGGESDLFGSSTTATTSNNNDSTELCHCHNFIKR